MEVLSSVKFSARQWGQSNEARQVFLLLHFREVFHDLSWISTIGAILSGVSNSGEYLSPCIMRNPKYRNTALLVALVTVQCANGIHARDFPCRGLRPPGARPRVRTVSCLHFHRIAGIAPLWKMLCIGYSTTMPGTRHRHALRKTSQRALV
jgi:hypothetical protein